MSALGRGLEPSAGHQAAAEARRLAESHEQIGAGNGGRPEHLEQLVVRRQ